jgi:hypothetical protein
MLQLKNQSPFAPAITLLPDKDGVDTIYVIVRGTFELAPRLKLAEKPLPPVLADEYWGEPGKSSLKHASELHVGKPASDVVLNGHAWGAGGRSVSQSVVSVQVAERRKVVKVFGDRAWRGSGFSSPQPFEKLPLVYERAFGGAHVANDQVVSAEERNPVGVGYAGQRSASDMTGQLLPNFEDPAALLDKVGDISTPASFGFVAAHWQPRRSYAGTYDETWQKKRAPYLPLDFSPRFLNAAPPELTFDRYLVGGEPIQVQGASPGAPIAFALPRCQLAVAVKIAGQTTKPPARIETVLIEPDDNRVTITWRASTSCDKHALQVEEVTVALEDLELGP